MAQVPTPPASPSPLAELDALLDDPDRWSALEPDRLRHLLFYQRLAYGLHPDESAIPRLISLQKVAVERLHPAVRRQIVVHLARAIERVHREHEVHEGAGCTNALLPFLLEEPDPSVVSAAAFEVALLLPLEQGDPLTGPRYVRQFIDQVERDDAKAGIVAGLLQLGDERVAPLVERGWTLLGPDGRESLALLVQSFRGLTGLAVRFLVAWLEDEARDTESAAFGIVSATLARAGRHAEEHGVSEFERVFPVADAPERASVPGKHLALEEFRPSIAERLLRLGDAETSGRLMPHLMSYWGFEEEAYRLDLRAAVERARAGGDGGAEGFRSPVRLELVPGWPEIPEKETLLEWGIFNPLGPTINSLRLTPGAQGAALVYTVYHPDASGSRVVALLPTGAGEDEVRAAVVSAMAGNGQHGEWLVRSLPDYVHLPATSPIDRATAAAGLLAARVALEAASEDEEDLRVHAARLQRLARDPWQTAAAEMDAVGVRTERVETLAANREPLARPRVEDYLAWLEVSAEDQHVQALRSQIPVAWQRLQDDAVQRNDADDAGDEVPRGDVPR